MYEPPSNSTSITIIEGNIVYSYFVGQGRELGEARYSKKVTDKNGCDITELYSYDESGETYHKVSLGCSNVVVLHTEINPICTDL